LIQRQSTKKRLGVMGSFVWDVIYGRDSRRVPIEEWGGITYALSGLDAALSDEWEIVPIMKIGADLASRAREFLGTLRHIAPDAALVEVPFQNNRVELHYYSDERRTEVLSGGVPPWSWVALQPLLHNIDALYVNMISGFELELETAQLMRLHYRSPIYCDLHSLVLAVQPTGLRTYQPLPNVGEWCACFDLLQVNEDELSMMAPDPFALAATAMARGARCLAVTLGKKGAAYFAASDFERLDDLRKARPLGASLGPVRTALVPVDAVDPSSGDPTGCGDVWGSTHFSRLLAGDKLSDAMRAANRAAARNVAYRGATGLANYLRGELTLT
jgi:pfkB family carbohydrate kinase